MTCDGSTTRIVLRHHAATELLTQYRGTGTRLEAQTFRKKSSSMPAPTPCTRHARHTWMAYCPTCTAWHLTNEIARRDGKGPHPESQSATTHHRSEPPPATVAVVASSGLAA
jgi:hypothetical protein